MNSGRALVAAAIERARANGEELPRKPRRPLRPHHPFAIEMEYFKALQSEVKHLFSEIQNWVTAEYPSILAEVQSKQPGPVRSDELSEDLHRFKRPLFLMWAQKVHILTQRAATIAKRVSEYGIREIGIQMKHVLGVDVFAAEPWIHDELAAFAHENAALIKNIGEKAIVDVERIVSEGVRRGTGTKEIKAAIQEQLGITERRAALIAVDQIGKLNGRMTELRQRAIGIERYRWRGVLDGRERPSHVEREGEIFRWDSPPPDGHPGMPIRCRCTAEPVMDEFEDLLDPTKKPSSTEGAGPAGEEQPKTLEKGSPWIEKKIPTQPSPEFLRQGVHFQSVASNLSKVETEAILNAGDKAGLADFLERKPLKDISITPKVEWGGESYPAFYLKGNIKIASEVSPELLEGVLKPGISEGVHLAASTPGESMQREMVHELGHHMQAEGGRVVEQVIRNAAKMGRPITTYANPAKWGQEEYFCETHSAYIFHPKELQTYDPVGYDMVKTVRGLLGVEK